MWSLWQACGGERGISVVYLELSVVKNHSQSVWTNEFNCASGPWPCDCTAVGKDRGEASADLDCVGLIAALTSSPL